MKHNIELKETNPSLQTQSEIRSGIKRTTVPKVIKQYQPMPLAIRKGNKPIIKPRVIKLYPRIPLVIENGINPIIGLKVTK